ncbi:MAG TPA: FliH/SctL family protein [bacterium]|nr:FliH/SctL family protein [bacterium]HOL48540.1 FliH/SctL family protein [bacterium]HPQ19928.1 FliH/SctL family protein [bacterium]
MSNIFESYNIITEPQTIIIGPNLGSGILSSSKEKDTTQILEEKIKELQSQKDLLEEQISNLEIEKEKKIKSVESEILHIKEKILKEAEEVKQRIINQAQQEAIKIKEESKNKGYSEGYNAGKEKIEKEFAAKFNTINLIINKLEQEKKEQLLKYENDIIHLTFDIAKKIIKQEIKSDRNIILNNLRYVIKKISDCKIIRIFVNPEEIQILKEYQSEIKSKLPSLEKIEFIADNNIDVGGCKVETEFGSFDASIKTQILELEQELLENLK